MPIDPLLLIALYLALGALTGIGCGLIIVPALGTSLTTIVITSISSIRAHHKRNAVLWPIFKRMIRASWLVPGWVADSPVH